VRLIAKLYRWGLPVVWVHRREIASPLPARPLLARRGSALAAVSWQPGQALPASDRPAVRGRPAQAITGPQHFRGPADPAEVVHRITEGQPNR
jgi:hypothetical protein